jgi:hypothetical protein
MTTGIFVNSANRAHTPDSQSPNLNAIYIYTCIRISIKEIIISIRQLHFIDQRITVVAVVDTITYSREWKNCYFESVARKYNSDI